MTTQTAEKALMQHPTNIHEPVGSLRAHKYSSNCDRLAIYYDHTFTDTGHHQLPGHIVLQLIGRQNYGALYQPKVFQFWIRLEHFIQPDDFYCVTYC